MLQASDATAGERIGALPEAGARLAREVADEFPAADGRPAGYSARWVRGPLDPGQSTDAIVVHHPAARYFSV
jgi:methionine synthase I (cobalamin-dependent)